MVRDQKYSKSIRKLSLQVNLFQKLTTSAEHVVYQNCSECQNKKQQQFVYTTCSAGILSLQFSSTINNPLSYYGLVDAKIRASAKDLPVQKISINRQYFCQRTGNLKVEKS